MAKERLIGCLLLAAASLTPQSPQKLYRQGRKSEKKAQYAQAYLYYAQAAAADPGQAAYWARAQSVQTKALIESPVAPGSASEPVAEDGPSLLGVITESEAREARRPLPPAELQARPGRQSFDLRGDARTLYEKIAKAFGLDVVFDGEYLAAPDVRFRVDEVDYRAALRIMEAASGTFVVPLGPKLFFVAKDTQGKRAEADSTAAVVVPIPEPVSLQDAQEMARTVQQAFEMQKFVIDSARRQVLMKDRLSKVRPAQLMLTQLLRHYPQVVIELELLDMNSRSSSSFGLQLPTQSVLLDFGKFSNATISVPSTFLKFLTFGAGKTFLGLGITDARLFATTARSITDSVLRATLRSVNGQPASLHIGDKYPVILQKYSGMEAAALSYTATPSFSFEDLGLTLKITPRVHGGGEVSMEVESEFKVLTGKALNDIPIISNRRFNSKVRLKEGEWAVVAGLLSSTEARTLGGIAGLSGVPLLGPLVSQHGKDTNRSTTLLVIKPRIIDPPPFDDTDRALWVGSESKLLTQM